MATLRDLRMMRQMQLQEAAAAIGMTPASLSRLERGLTKPRVETVAKISEFYGIPMEKVSDFLVPKNVSKVLKSVVSQQQESAESALPDDITADLSPLERMQLEAYRDGLLSSRQFDQSVRIPVIGDTAAGFGSLAGSEWTGEFAALPGDCLRGSNIRDFFALNVRGRSMEPRIMDGDIAVIRQQNDVEDGEIALVVYGDDLDSVGSYGTLKQIRKESDGALSLVALNPEFETLTLRGNDLTSVRIQGKLVQIIRAF